MSSVPDKPVEVISVAPSAPKKSAYVPKSQQPVQKEQLTQQQQIDKAQIDKQSEKAAQVQKDVEDVVAVMQTNIAKVVARGEKLETLQSKTDDLSTAGFNFKKTAGKVESEMWWKVSRSFT